MTRNYLLRTCICCFVYLRSLIFRGNVNWNEGKIDHNPDDDRLIGDIYEQVAETILRGKRRGKFLSRLSGSNLNYVDNNQRLRVEMADKGVGLADN